MNPLPANHLFHRMNVPEYCSSPGPAGYCVLFLLISLIAPPSPAFATDLMDTVRFMANLRDRSPGTPGAARAADYMEEAFKSLIPLPGTVTGRQHLRIPARKVHTSRMRLASGTSWIPIRPFLGNVLSPGAIPEPGLNAPLIYVGKGTPTDCNGQVLEGAVVLMDMDSGANWTNVAMLGVRAIIYVDDIPANQFKRGIFDKASEVNPVDFPRFWMTGKEARRLFGPLEQISASRTHIFLQASVSWENVRADTVYCLIPGTDPGMQDEIHLIEAFYDAPALVPGLSPGADASLSAATLVEIARSLGTTPPGRTTLLVATPGYGRNMAGMRECIWALVTPRKKIKREQKGIHALLTTHEHLLQLLDTPAPLIQDTPADQALIHDALLPALKQRVHELNSRITGLTTQGKGAATHALGRSLRKEKMLLRRLIWRPSYSNLTPEEHRALQERLPGIRARSMIGARDARMRTEEIATALSVRSLVDEKRITACTSLHLSSRGDGLGAFNDGWMYNLKATINRAGFYTTLDDLLQTAAQSIPEGTLFRDTLRPNQLRPWQNFLPGKPALGGEIPAMAGLPGLTLATTHDVQPAWTTPDDRVEGMNPAFARAQSRLVCKLARALCDTELAPPGRTMRNGFATLSGTAEFLRQGELFADMPAAGSLVQVYQGQRYSCVMTDATGHFRVAGLARKTQVLDKAIVEAFRFDPETGKILWAIDKKQTGKSAYRVRMNRRDMDTSLIMFSCAQMTLFNLFAPRTFNPMTRIQLIDARMEAAPVRYWYSRLDTRRSTLSSIFLKPDVPLKLTLSDTLLGKKMILLNNSPEDSLGQGYIIRNHPLLTLTEYRTARDMWNLLRPRIANLESHGIFSQAVRDMQLLGTASLTRAEKALENLRYDTFMEESRISWALASRVYADINATQKDVLFGVLFYIALFIPFAFCVERVLFAFASIHKRIIAFLGILGLVIAVIYSVHPAFNLTYSPLVVILAFFILGLSLLVSMIIFLRFEQEMASLQQRAQNIQDSGIAPFKAFAAAFSIGVTNLRRRKTRTALTCVTLIILTFTIMNFTSVKTGRTDREVTLSPTAPHHGILLRTMNWRDLPEHAFSVLNTAFAENGMISPRIWLENKDRSRPVQVPVQAGDKTTTAGGMIGLGPEEPAITGINRILTRGTWLTSSSAYAVLLPETLAEFLDIDPENPRKNHVRIWGMDFLVQGCFDGQGLDQAMNLDGEPVTPVCFPCETATRVSEVEAEAAEDGEDVRSYQTRYLHTPGDHTIILPAPVLSTLGGQFKGMVVRPPAGKDDQKFIRDIGKRFALMLFSGRDTGTALSYSSGATLYSGMAAILIPLLITVLIVLNTMIGSVFERKREIGVYTSVGLAPSHVAFLFVAEAMAFAVISVVMGYLLAQTVSRFLAGTPLWAGMTANYSSLAGVAAMLLVMAVVLLSVIYPSRVAARIAIPDVNRSWTMPPAGSGPLEITLPFLVRLTEQECLGGFLLEYYESHVDISHGRFSAADLNLEFACPMDPVRGESLRCFSMNLRVWLAPFDFGVRQHVALTCCPAPDYPKFLEIRVRLSRETGEKGVWHRLNKSFVNDLRKQLLIWRAQNPASRQSCADRLNDWIREKGISTAGSGLT